MSGGEGRQLSDHDIQLVKNRIERCLQLYMSKKEVINALIIQDNIDPHFTELVWQRLEEENQEFFKAYYLKLLVKDQIMEFNRLLSEQVELMHRIGLSRVAPMVSSNGLHVSPRTVEGPIHNRKIEVSPNVFLSQNTNVELAQRNTNVELAQRTDRKIVKAEAGYAGCSPFDLSLPGNYLESRPLMGNASVSSFSSVDSNAQHLNGTLLDGDTSSFGFLEQIPPSFNLPEMPADFNTSSDLLESYCRPPFLATNTNNFGDPHGDVERLDPGSENLRFQCFGGE